VTFGLGGTAGLALAGALVDRIGTSRLFAVEAVVALVALVPALHLRRLVAKSDISRYRAAASSDRG